MNTVENNCDNIISPIKTIVVSLQRKKDLILSSIGHTVSKRSTILGFVTKAARLLYGICNFECIKKFNFNIGQAQNTSQLKLVKEQIKVVKLKHEPEIYEFYNATFVMNESLNVSRERQLKDFLHRHFTLVGLKLTQHMAETDTLLEIIQQAKIGVIHPSLITPQVFLEQVKDIKVSLPGGTDLPTDLDIANIYELVKLSDLAIYYANENLVFVLSLPLIYQNDFILYNLIPVPVCILNDCVYIKPSNKYLAISKSKEHYATYDEFYYTHCKHARDFLLCPEINPLHPRNIRPTCEVSLLQDPAKVPPSCEVMHVQIATSIFHKKRFKNEWIYVTNYDVIFITCDEDKESTSHTLKGVGILHLNETCKGYATRDILIPGKVDYKAEYIDFNPRSTIDRTRSTPHLQNNNLMEDYHVKTNNMEDLHIVSNSKKQLDSQSKINDKLTELQEMQDINNYVIYVIFSIIIITIMIIFIYIMNIVTVRKNRKTNTGDSQE